MTNCIRLSKLSAGSLQQERGGDDDRGSNGDGSDLDGCTGATA